MDFFITLFYLILVIGTLIITPSLLVLLYIYLSDVVKDMRKKTPINPLTISSSEKLLNSLTMTLVDRTPDEIKRINDHIESAVPNFENSKSFARQFLQNTLDIDHIQSQWNPLGHWLIDNISSRFNYIFINEYCMNNPLEFFLKIDGTWFLPAAKTNYTDGIPGMTGIASNCGSRGYLRCNILRNPTVHMHRLLISRTKRKLQTKIESLNKLSKRLEKFGPAFWEDKPHPTIASNPNRFLRHLDYKTYKFERAVDRHVLPRVRENLITTILAQYRGSYDILKSLRNTSEYDRSMDDPYWLTYSNDYISRLVKLPDFLGLPYKICWSYTLEDRVNYDYDHTLVTPHRHLQGYDYINTRSEKSIPKFANIDHWLPHLETIERHVGFKYRVEHDVCNSISLIRSYEVPEVIPFTSICMRSGEIFLGTNIITGEPYYVSFDKLLHLLVAGASGMGKSVFLNQFLQSLFFNIDMIDAIVMVDLKGGVELVHYANLHEKVQVTYEYDQLVKLISYLRNLVSERLNVMRSQRIKSHDRYVFLIIDEYAQISLHQPNTKEEKETHKQLLADMAALAMLGRAAGLRIIGQLQRPTVDAIPANVRENLTNRIGFRMANRQSAAMLFGDTQDLPTDPLKLKRGQFNFYDDSQGQIVTLQSSMIDDDQIPLIKDEPLKIAAE